MQIAFRQTRTALQTWPDFKQWIGALRLAVPALAMIALMGFLAQWLAWSPVTDISALLISAALLFVAWHPVQALTIGPAWAEIFLHPTFWIATLILGIILAHIRIVSRSLWPVILIHWFAVLIWKSLLGGPFY